MHYCPPDPCSDELRLEAVTTCVGFDDILDETLYWNHHQLDNMIVVTSHEDRLTKSVCSKHSVTCVETDLFKKNQRPFNKGAAINIGFGHFQYNGWRMHLDADIALSDNFRRMLFNHTSLNKQNIYGCDRVDVNGRDELDRVLREHQHRYRFLMYSSIRRPIGARFVSSLYGYVPIGFFQLWHASRQRDYPYSLGNAAHDDVLFAAQWPECNRQVLPTAICYHLQEEGGNGWGQNWSGRTQPRLKPRKVIV